MQQRCAYYTGSINMDFQQRTRHEMAKQIAKQNKLKRSKVMNTET